MLRQVLLIWFSALRDPHIFRDTVKATGCEGHSATPGTVLTLSPKALYVIKNAGCLKGGSGFFFAANWLYLANYNDTASRSICLPAWLNSQS